MRRAKEWLIVVAFASVIMTVAGLWAAVGYRRLAAAEAQTEKPREVAAGPVDLQAIWDAAPEWGSVELSSGTCYLTRPLKWQGKSVKVWCRGTCVVYWRPEPEFAEEWAITIGGRDGSSQMGMEVEGLYLIGPNGGKGVHLRNVRHGKFRASVASVDNAVLLDSDPTSWSGYNELHLPALAYFRVGLEIKTNAWVTKIYGGDWATEKAEAVHARVGGNGVTTFFAPCLQSLARDPTWFEILVGDCHILHPYFECSAPGDQPSKSKGRITIGPEARDVLMLGGPSGEVTWSDKPSPDGKSKRNRWLYRREN